MMDDQIPDGYTELRKVYESLRSDYAELRREMKDGLRDQFATAFMHALIGREVDFYMVETTARLAYQQADAMLAAREKEGGR